MWTGFAAMNPDDAGNPPSFRFSKTHNEELWTGALPWRPQGKEMKAACVGSSGKKLFLLSYLSQYMGPTGKVHADDFFAISQICPKDFLKC